jgi:hypothetical protein
VGGRIRESERSIRARRRGNARGAKGPHRSYVTNEDEEDRLKNTTSPTADAVRAGVPAADETTAARELPDKLSQLRWKLGHKANQEPFYGIEANESVDPSEKRRASTLVSRDTASNTSD